MKIVTHPSGVLEFQDALSVDHEYVVGWLERLKEHAAILQSPTGRRVTFYNLAKLLSAETHQIFIVDHWEERLKEISKTRKLILQRS